MNLWIQPTISLRRGFPIRTSADQRSLASPRGFSQRATSFIASWRQGIHRTPLSRSRTHPTPPARRTKPRMAIADHRPPGPVLGRRRHYSCLSQLTHTSDEPSHPTARPPPRGAPAARADNPSARSDSPSQRTRPNQVQRPGRETAREVGHVARRPNTLRMEASGFEPLTPCLQSRCSTS